MSAFDAKPDLVSGRATSNEAAIALVDRLCRVPALNLLDPGSRPALRRILVERLATGAPGDTDAVSTGSGEPALRPSGRGHAIGPGPEGRSRSRITGCGGRGLRSPE